MNPSTPGGKLGAAGEAALVALAMNGDDAAFGELVRRRQEAIRQLLRRLARDPALADDLAQQTFVQAWKSIRGLKSPAAFGAWLRKLCVNCWLQHARARQQEVLLGEEALLTLSERAGADVASGAVVAERLDLDAALGALPAAMRLCVVLAYSEGMSHSEIVDATAIPLGTVKSHISRGAARLRELLQAYGDRHAR